MNHLCGIHIRKITSQEKNKHKTKNKNSLEMKFSKFFKDLVFGSSSKKGKTNKRKLNISKLSYQ